MKPKKLSLATPSTILLLLFVLAAASPFAFAQRPASLHLDWTIVLTGRRAPNVTRGTRVSISIHNGPTILSGHY